MKKIVAATLNSGKLHELSILLAPMQIVSQADLGISAAEETAATFVENALIKARHASVHSNMPALADDSGLVVPALRGSPGIHSARYAGLQAKDEENIHKLLHTLEKFEDSERYAFFYCALVLVRFPEDPMPLIATGTIRGLISKTPRGTGGFGYDPIFYLPELQRSMAELETNQKNKISHRARALQRLSKLLQETPL